ncbi:MAG TPA: hypothetical protein VIT45_11310 [Allosphingosinicella sp.]
MNRWSLAFAALSLASCATRPDGPVWSVRQVMDNSEAVEGKVIDIRGWVQRCERLGCGLYDSREEYRRSQDPDRGPGPGDPEGLGFHLSIGTSAWFDEEAALNAPSYVIMTARVDGRCMNDPKHGTIALCIDRSGTLEPIRIIRWGK